MSVIRKDLGIATAYGYAVSKGYTGTEEEFAELMASYATVAEEAQEAAEQATQAVQTAQAAVNSATTKAGEAATSASGAATSASQAGQSATAAAGSASTASAKVAEAGTSATNAAASETVATQAAQVATTKAWEASASATAASQSATAAAGSASDASDDADRAETAAGSVSAAAEQIVTNTADIAGLKDDLSDTYTFENHVELASFCEKISGQSLVAYLNDIDSGYKTYTGLALTARRFVTSNAYQSHVFRTPYRGFSFRLFASKIYVIETLPNGEPLETLDVVEVLAENSSPKFDTFTINYDPGTYVIFDYNKTTRPLFFTDITGVYKSQRLELDNIQDTFARYSNRDTGTFDFGNVKLNVVKYAGKLPNGSSGALASNASYNTYVFKVPVSSLTIKCVNGFRAQITYIDPNDITSNGYMKEYLYANASSRVEIFTASYGDYVAIGVGTSSGEIDLKTDYIKSFSLPSLKLDYMQAGSFYKYETTANGKYLYIYYKSGDKYVRWQLHNVPAAGTNSNTWQIGHVCGLDGSLENMVELVAGGEFELAFKEYGAADYCGGNNHGDENTIDFTLMIDGKMADITNMVSGYHAFNRINAIEHAYVNRCDTPSENILKHQKIWIFEDGTVKVRQALEYLEAVTGGFLCCMMAANRSVFTHGVRQGRVATEVMTSTSYDRVTTLGNEMMYVMYGDRATAKVTAKTCAHTPEASLWINNAETVNKLYYDFFGGHPTHEEAQGTVLWWEAEYDIAYN